MRCAGWPMSEIDLIPPRYRRRKAVWRWALRGAAVYGFVALALIGARGALSRSVQTEQSQLEQIQLERAQAESERARLDRLEAERTRLTQQLALLEGLRGGPAAKQIFTAVDSALDEQIWFRRWKFQRAGEVVENREKAGEAGYFTVLPRQAEGEPERAWRVATHMEISGEAADHSALARFVRRLGERGEIESARILNTRAQQLGGAEFVEFELAVVVRSAR
jgi:cell division protein FtsB